MSTSTRTRVVTFQRSYRQRTPRPTPLPLTQKVPSAQVVSPSRLNIPRSASMTTTTFAGPAMPTTPHPFSSLAAPQSAAPCEDPRSPKPQKHQEANLSLFTEQKPLRIAQDLHVSMASFPRTPYPSAPIFSPDTVDAKSKINALKTASGEMTPRPTRVSQKAAPAPLPVSTEPLDLAVVGRPRAVNSPLTQAFWQSFSLVDNTVPSRASDVYSPLSAVPPMIFGSRNGMLSLPEDSLKSPGIPTPLTAKQSRITSPAPRDPFAAFPTFTVVMEADGKTGSIDYPPSALVEC